MSFSSGCPEVASSVVYGETTGVNPNASTFGKVVTTLKQVSHGQTSYYPANRSIGRLLEV